MWIIENGGVGSAAVEKFYSEEERCYGAGDFPRSKPLDVYIFLFYILGVRGSNERPNEIRCIA